ncbi:hypothetical protein HZC21_02470, partial [Candidatus Peregrinibacteria bacterium]|nr:hypothetical protein [Candidatus Peregrinibacteria bacterium]
MHRLKKLWTSLTNTEHRFVVIALVVFAASSVAWLAINVRERSVFIPVAGGSYVEALIGQPIAINPIISSNPADQDISRIIYSNLDSLINDSRIESDDRTYVLKLKEDLFWDDGETLTSDDVIFTIKTIQNPDARSTFSRPWHGVVTERISDLQLKLTLPTPYAFFNETIAKLPVIPRHIFGAIPTANLKLSTYNLEPVGSGPYRFKSFSKRKDGFITNYRLVVNERYHGSKPFIKNFVFEFYNTHDEIIDALRFRRVDGFGSMTPIMSSLKTASYLNLNRLPMPRYYALFLNPLSNSKLKIKEIRKALTEAIDTKTIASDALQGEA